MKCFDDTKFVRNTEFYPQNEHKTNDEEDN